MSIYLVLAVIFFVLLNGAYIAGFVVEGKQGMPRPLILWSLSGICYLAFVIFLALYFRNKVYAETDPHLGGWIGFVMGLFVGTVYVAIFGKRLGKIIPIVDLALFFLLGVTLLILFVNMSRETLNNEAGLRLFSLLL